MIQAAQLLLSLSILIVLHELGHFIPARIFKTRVEKFYLFFDPWFSLFKRKRGDTEYGIGWLPLGGYVKIAGMIDESMDKEQMKLPPQPWEFRAKPAWQRLIIMVGGVTVNLILGFLIYIFILFIWGEKALPVENAKYGIACDSVAMRIGLKNGDKILAIDNIKPGAFEDIGGILLLENARTIDVERNGMKISVAVPADFTNNVLKGKKKDFIAPAYPVVIDTILPDSEAKKTGLQKNDRIFAVNSDTVNSPSQLIAKVSSQKNKKVTLSLIRDNETITLSPKVSDEGKIGFGLAGPDKFLTFETTYYSFLESIPAGIAKGAETLSKYIKQFKLIFTKEGASQLGGFYSIGKIYAPVWDWQSFWSITALLSIVLAFMNILPIPALDGGHILFLSYEIISGKKPGEKVMEYAQYAGMALLLALMIYANTDWIRLNL